MNLWLCDTVFCGALSFVLLTWQPFIYGILQRKGFFYFMSLSVTLRESLSLRILFVFSETYRSFKWLQWLGVLAPFLIPKVSLSFQILAAFSCYEIVVEWICEKTNCCSMSIRACVWGKSWSLGGETGFGHFIHFLSSWNYFLLLMTIFCVGG